MKKKAVNNSEMNKNHVKFRALDVVIIILIISAVVGVYFRYNIIDAVNGRRNMQDYTVSFEIKDIKYTTEKHIKVGDKVYYNDSGNEIGTLIKASEDASEKAENALIVVPAVKTLIPEGSSSAIEISYPADTRIDASGRMICHGRFSEDSGLLIGGTDHIAPGEKLSVRTERVTIDIVITNITPTE